MDGIKDNGDGTISIDLRQFNGQEIIRFSLMSLPTVNRLATVATACTFLLPQSNPVWSTLVEVLNIVNAPAEKSSASPHD